MVSGAHQILGVEPSGCNALAAALAEAVRFWSRRKASPPIRSAHPASAISPMPSWPRPVPAPFWSRTHDIKSAQLWLWDNLRLITEPGGATALAPLLSGRYQAAPARTDRRGDLRGKCRSGEVWVSGSTHHSTTHRSSEQPLNLPLLVKADDFSRGHLGQARHGHDVAADHHDELGPADRRTSRIGTT